MAFGRLTTHLPKCIIRARVAQPGSSSDQKENPITAKNAATRPMDYVGQE